MSISLFSVIVVPYCRLRGCSWWWSVGIAVVMFVVLYACNFNVYMRAGHGWFATNSTFLRTDRLTRMRARVIMSGTYVGLWDADGRHVDVPLSELTGNRKIWELVRAGISASRTAGLVADDQLTARLFGLPTCRTPSAAAPAQALDVPSENEADGRR